MLDGGGGPSQYTVTISGSGTVEHDSSNHGTWTWKATCDGRTMRWEWKVGLGKGSCTFTLNADGKTAIMTNASNGLMGIGAFSGVGTFHKISP